MQTFKVHRPIQLAIAIALGAAIVPGSVTLAQARPPSPTPMPLPSLIAPEVNAQPQLPHSETMPTDHVAPLENTLWYLTSYTNDAGDTIAVQTFDQDASIRFSDGQVSGNATCNRFFGTYSLEVDALTIQPGGSTLMACPEEFMAQEQVFMGALEQVEGYGIAADTLQLYDAEGNVLLTFDRAVSPALTGTLWQLIAYNNGREAVVSTLTDSTITATFDGNGRLSGFAGCNNYGASYTVTADAINIGPGMRTRKFCAQPDGVMAQETAYLQALEMADVFTIEGSTLILSTDDGATVARFNAAEAAGETSTDS
ncbi:META domain-containing protein [Nodosilinea sp. LEGE 07088]|uniref:META domain-containing protein n=1 Tax=Nodosilinea sp. LEGE 07088 TaxID=2777968 RepID=UPI001882781F|nr:META domain-containing protein [Nodosilinea sp. LEGE 07088]MBE9141234.1 META domain-containing protein [Nodosilinea sp. LEGE 07088]